ncbi:MAG: UvrB/UvrC motif-containing protein, partial [Gemmatimonadota bacterium]|nr:UvrB/UvrC motif-containing protein [Gemmatimonadota bacterium]
GRPDGKQPYGKASLLDHYQAVQQEQQEKYGPDAQFSLTHEDCEKLQNESIQYYHRRISFFELEAFEEAGMDAEHNLEIMDLIRTHAMDENDKLSFEQFRPFVIMHRTRAHGLLSAERKDFNETQRFIEQGIREIEDFYKSYDREDLLEESQELKLLREWAEQIDGERPRSPIEQLQEDLEKAVENEEFERAAQLRDELKKHDGP